MTRLSNRQFPMLEIFSGGSYLKVEDAQLYDQRPFRSMLIRKWVAYMPGKGFHITDLGKSAYREFLNTDIGRKNPHLPLTAYFDPTAYGLRMPSKKARVHMMPKKATAA